MNCTSTVASDILEISDDLSTCVVTSAYHHTHSPKSHLKLFKCPNFCSTGDVFIDENEINIHLKLRCTQCNTCWYVCYNCNYQSKHFRTTHQLKRHFYTTCKSKLMHNNNNEVDSARKKKSKTVSAATNKSTLCFQFDVFSKLGLFGRKQNKMYYFYEQFNQGPHYLVGLSQYKLNNIAHLLESSEVFCHFRLAYLFLSMSPTQSHLQTKVLQYFHRNLNPAYTRRRWGCGVPLDQASIRRLYTEGANSILRQLPHPNILNVDGHSYVPISEIVQDCLANDNPICDLKNISEEYNENEVKYIWDSKNVKSIVSSIPSSSHNTENETIHIMVVRWSDDFEPNNIKKNKGNSIWTFTITIIGSENNHHCEDNTYIVAIGHKDSDHSQVEQKFLDDLRAINGNDKLKYYVASRKKIVSVKVHLIACVADLPERCDTCNISRGNSNYTTRWGYSSHINVLQNHLRSCQNCFESGVKNMKNLNFRVPTNCRNCLNWNFESNQDLTKFEVPNDYPDKSTHLKLHKLNFDDMISACDVASVKYSQKQWTANQVTMYLSYKGIKPSLISKILNQDNQNTMHHGSQTEHANRMKFLLQNNITDESLDMTLMKLPAVWLQPYEMNKWIDAPMHLLFLGVVKKTNSVIDKWSTLFSKQKTLMKTFNAMIPSIYHMKLEWCKILPLCPNLSFGGYVSENWAAVARLMCWMYQSIPIILTEEEIDVFEPTKSLKNWTGAEMRKWLVLHGMKRSGKVSELRERIAPFLENPETKPPIISKYRCPPDIIRNTIVSMHNMISRLMQQKYCTNLIAEANAYIHLYLNCLSSWTQYITTPNKKPLWLSSYSMLNLLNLPEVMEQHGPLRNFWEGSTMGEGILKQVKQHYNCMQSNWYMSLTRRTLQFRSLHQIHKKIERLEDTTDSDSTISENLCFKELSNNYHTYPDFLCLQRAFENGQPISIIVGEKMRIYAVVTCDILYEIVIRGYTEEHFGHHYYLFREPKLLDNTRLHKESIIEFGLMLPRLTGSDDFENMTEKNCYTIITSEWKQLDNNKNILMPKFEFKGDIAKLYN